MVILNYEQFSEIQQVIHKFRGHSIDCNRELVRRFPQHSPEMLGSILSREVQQRLKQSHSRISARAEDLLADYGRKIKSGASLDVLLKMSLSLRIPPLSLCRMLLLKKYSHKTKAEVSEMLRHPDIIPDSVLGANVGYCLYNENMEGPITDTIRRCIGEEYEMKLKQMAKDMGMVFYDEGDLRRTGYDKTPDLKLAIPCLYKGRAVNWIESKASFGDMDSHQKYVRDQLISYGNRFGAGIVIYWFGYLDMIADCAENGDFITVVDNFPAPEELEFLKFNIPDTCLEELNKPVS
ncbi:CDAN1-interacting nuclease 1 [Culex pipiens pallens]|uniref:CDAN1-interacting nuclease 1 n=1 Tax=Culex pipiens pallens TaxID=42434 RepID=UPI001954272F|nr:CDAN1-interacting nuclease 1 [Culex pipiens pallens]